MKKVWKRWAALLMTICLAALMMVPVMASESMSTDTTAEVKTGVLQIWVEYGSSDASENRVKLEGGTCFLINEEYVLTSYHVVDIAANKKEYTKVLEEAGYDVDEDDFGIWVYVNLDQAVEAEIDKNVFSSTDVADFALLKLERTVTNRNALTLGESNDSALPSGSNIYAFGFKATSMEADQFNTELDVSVEDGIVSKYTADGGVSFVEHTATLTSGNSGGPLVNADGAVVGVNSYLISADDSGAAGGDSYYAVSIDTIRQSLDTFGIAYTPSDGSSTVSTDEEDDTTDTTSEDTTDTVEEEETVDKTELNTLITQAEGKSEDSYTSASWSTLSTALTAAQEVADSDTATQEEVDAAAETLETAINGLEEASSLPFGLSMPVLIGIIVVIAVIIILLIIFVVIKPGKKKKEDNGGGYYDDSYNNGGGYGGAPIDPGRTQNNGGGGYGGYGGGDGSSETTVLDSGAGETTLLGGAGAYLIRKKNGEKISINTPSFAIGKERRRVSYCISDNSSVSRYHAVINRKGADYYITDQQSSNFTYVNGVQVSPFAETLLTDRSIIKLSDEEFEFHLS